MPDQPSSSLAQQVSKRQKEVELQLLDKISMSLERHDAEIVRAYAEALTTLRGNPR